MGITAMKLARDVAGDADTGGGGAGIGHGAGDVGSARSTIVDSRDRSVTAAPGRIGVPEGEVLYEAREGHGGVV